MRNGLTVLALVLLAQLATAEELTPTCTTCAVSTSSTGCDPAWTARAKLLYLHRESPDATPLISANNSNVTLFDASQFHFDLSPGTDISISRRVDSSDLEIRYFGFYEASAHQNFTLNVASEFSGQPLTVFIPQTSFNTEYTTDINSVEVSPGIYTARGFRFQAGLRWLNLTENLRSTIIEPVPRVVTNSRASAGNNLYGVQVGADGALLERGAFRLNGFGKAGIYYNDAEGTSTSLDTRGLGINARATDHSAAFVGELGLELEYAISRRLSLTFGGQIMWLTGVAVAGDQASGVPTLGGLDILLRTGTIHPQTDGEVTLYGLNAGLVVRW